MKLGIMSDSHDHVPMIEKACRVFNDERVDLVIHAGDYVAPFALSPLKQILKCDYVGVFGNNDGERVGLQQVADGRLRPSPTELELEGWKVLVAHEMPILEALIAGGWYDLIVYGHNHQPEIRRVGSTLAVNPGECGGWLRGRRTVAVATMDPLEARIIEL